MSNELTSKLPQLEVRPDDRIERDQVLAFLRSEIGWTEMMTIGNISTLIGKAKSRKTFFMTLLVSGLITNKNYMIKSNLEGKNVVIFDTEQGRYHVWKVAKRIESIVGKWPCNIKIFGLRPLTVQERVSEIENYVYINDIDLLIIDGIRDLVTDINSAEQATEIVGKLMKWSYEREMHICTVLHQNKADDNADASADNAVDNSGDKSETADKGKAAAQEQPALQTYSKYDFIPGEKIIFYEDFSQDAIGDFPALWNTNGSAEVVTSNLFPGNWLQVKPQSYVGVWTDQPIVLPENYTFEFDVNKNSSCQ